MRFLLFSSALSFVPVSHGHLFLEYPVPIQGNAVKEPLGSSGANFPCHGASLANIHPQTILNAGSSYPLTFALNNGRNTAVHGGGSCQISITYMTKINDLREPKNWKVLKSFVGGCPTNAKGNLADGQAKSCKAGGVEPECVNDLSFEVPSEVRNGSAILAWTWFNNVGNREMYMNCAAVEIRGGRDQLLDLDSMTVANLQSINSCRTTENYNTDFGTGKKYTELSGLMNYPIKSLVGCDPLTLSTSGSKAISSSNPISGANGRPFNNITTSASQRRAGRWNCD